MKIDHEQRRVPIPKWKSLKQTPSRELASARGIVPSREVLEEQIEHARELYLKWQRNPTIDNALEVVDRAHSLPNDPLLYGPVSQVINSPLTSRVAKMVAERVFLGAFEASRLNTDDDCQLDPFEAISRNKKRLHSEPRNAILLSEQARLHSIIGQNERARRLFAQALAAAPNNRHVLRSFSRFMVHVREPDIAKERLVRSDGIRHDPWIQAAEIALSGAMRLPSKAARVARENLDAGRIARHHVSELAVSLAVLEREHGAEKRFRRRLRDSLVLPTDNALSQILWFETQAREGWSEAEEISRAAEKMASGSAEAETYIAIRQKRWSDAIDSFRAWQTQEQFSSHIATQGSFYAIAFAGRYLDAVEICNVGLKANFLNVGILNNLCVAQNRLKQYADSRATFNKINDVNPRWALQPGLLATAGMVEFADGNIPAARSRFEAAIFAENNGDTRTKVRVLMHWLFEEAFHGQIGHKEFEVISELVGRAVDKRQDDTNLSEEWKLMRSDASANILEHSPRDEDLHPLERILGQFLIM